MRHAMLVGCAVLLFVPPAFAGSITITSTAEQDAAVEWKVAIINARKLASNPRATLYTADQYKTEALLRLLDAEVAEWRATLPGAVTERFKAMTPAERADLCTRLGIASCPK